ncbi:hypothetical protein B9G55_17540 [Saccharibacillus sp. O16]|nr:hypothetical protein B9G55_17540 [Saccharibacillus sp. O16]
MARFFATPGLILLVWLASGCASPAPEGGSSDALEHTASSAGAAQTKNQTPRERTIGKNTTNKARTECMPTIEYMDALMLGDIHYVNYRSMNDPVELPPEAIGEIIDTVAYAMSDDACTDFVMQSRDATFLPAGTPIHKLRDYDTDFRVYADGRIYETSDNPHAKTVGDLYDIEGKVKSLDRISGNDHSFMWSYSQEDTEAFVSDLLKLEYVGFDEIHKNNPPEYKTSLRLQLKDGTSIKLPYLPKANALVMGAYGTERMREIVQKKP